MIQLNNYLETIEEPLAKVQTRKTLLFLNKEGIPRWEWCLDMANKNIVINRDRNTVYYREAGTIKTTKRCIDFIDWLRSQ